jgi:hypothetical protein
MVSQHVRPLAEGRVVLHAETQVLLDREVLEDRELLRRVGDAGAGH